MIRATINSLLALFVVAAFGVATVSAQTTLGNQLTTHANWDLGTSAWEVGNSGGWNEADMVPHTYTVDADSTGSGGGFLIDICLEAVVTQGSATYYGYVASGPYYGSVDPGIRLDGISIALDDEVGPVACVNCSLWSVTNVGLGGGTCDSGEELGYRVVFEVSDPDSTAHFFFGGQLGYPGATAADAATVDGTNSPSNKGGVWQSRVESGGDKTTQITAPGAALPVELVSFDARLDGSDVVLSWETASETNNAGFAVEHSDNGGEFTEIAFVPGAGTTFEARTYGFTVTDIGAGLHRFRLKQLDFDGAFTFSPMVEVTSEVPGTHLLSEAYPNPFNPSTSFSLAVSREQEVSVNVYDMLGRHISSLYRGTLEANVARTFSVNAANWTSGTYTVVVEGEAFRDSRSLVLLK
jgi:hypothetical protein